MRRKYRFKVEVWQSSAQFDDYSGNVNEPTKIGDSWANVSTIPLNKITDYGLDITQEAIVIKTRWRDDLDYFQNGIYFKYKSFDWFPTRVFNKDLINEEITIIAEVSR